VLRYVKAAVLVPQLFDAQLWGVVAFPAVSTDALGARFTAAALTKGIEAMFITAMRTLARKRAKRFMYTPPTRITKLYKVYNNILLIVNRKQSQA